MDKIREIEEMMKSISKGLPLQGKDTLKLFTKVSVSKGLSYIIRLNTLNVGEVSKVLPKKEIKNLKSQVSIILEEYLLPVDTPINRVVNIMIREFKLPNGDLKVELTWRYQAGETGSIRRFVSIFLSPWSRFSQGLPSEYTRAWFVEE